MNTIKGILWCIVALGWLVGAIALYALVIVVVGAAGYVIARSMSGGF